MTMTYDDTAANTTVANHSLPFSPVLPAASPIHLEHRFSADIPGLRIRVVSLMLRLARYKGWIEDYYIDSFVSLKLPTRPHEVDECGGVALRYWWGTVMFDAKRTDETRYRRQPITVAQQKRLSRWGKALDLIFGLSRVRPVVVIMPPRTSQEEAIGQ